MQFEQDLRYALLFSRIIHGSYELFLRILAREEEALERCLEVAAGEISQRQWMRWLLPRLPASLLKAVRDRVL